MVVIFKMTLFFSFLQNWEDTEARKKLSKINAKVKKACKAWFFISNASIRIAFNIESDFAHFIFLIYEFLVIVDSTSKTQEIQQGFWNRNWKIQRGKYYVFWPILHVHFHWNMAIKVAWKQWINTDLFLESCFIWRIRKRGIRLVHLTQQFLSLPLCPLRFDPEPFSFVQSLNLRNLMKINPRRYPVNC